MVDINFHQYLLFARPTLVCLPAWLGQLVWPLKQGLLGGLAGQPGEKGGQTISMSVTIGHRPDRGRCPKGVKVGSSAICFHDATSHLLAPLSTPFCPLSDSPRGDIIIESKISLLTQTISMQTLEMQ